MLPYCIPVNHIDGYYPGNAGTLPQIDVLLCFHLLQLIEPSRIKRAIMVKKIFICFPVILLQTSLKPGLNQ